MPNSLKDWPFYSNYQQLQSNILLLSSPIWLLYMKKEHPEDKKVKEHTPPWWYYNWVPPLYTPIDINAEQQQTTSANNNKPENQQQQTTADDKQKEIDKTLPSVLPSLLSPQLSSPATKLSILLTTTIVDKSSKSSWLSLLANYLKQTKALKQKINENIAENEQKSDSQLQKNWSANDYWW